MPPTRDAAYARQFLSIIVSFQLIFHYTRRHIDRIVETSLKFILCHNESGLHE